MSEKDFIKDGLQNEEIVSIIKQIRAQIEIDASDNNVEKLRKQFEFFQQDILYYLIYQQEEKNLVGKI